MLTSKIITEMALCERIQGLRIYRCHHTLKRLDDKGMLMLKFKRSKHVSTVLFDPLILLALCPFSLYPKFVFATPPFGSK